MTVLARATAHRAGSASRAARQLQKRAETRFDEIGAVMDVETDYELADRAGDLEIESKFAALYQLVDTEEEKQAVALAFAVWERSERREDLAVKGAVGDAVETMRANNEFWLGSYVPEESGGAA